LRERGKKKRNLRRAELEKNGKRREREGERGRRSKRDAVSLLYCLVSCVLIVCNLLVYLI